MYGGKFCVSKSIGLACSETEIYQFCFNSIEGASQKSEPGRPDR